MIVSLEEAVYPILPKGGPQIRFEAWRDATEAGFDLDLRSQLWHDEAREDIMERMWEVLGVSELPSPLIVFEEEEREKLGPYSIQFPFADREGSLSEFYQNVELDSVDTENFSNSIAAILPRGTLEPLSISQAVENLPKRKGLGLPYLGSNPSDLQHYVNRADAVLAGEPSYINDAMLYWRGQPGGPDPSDVKQRNVEGMDKLDAILGGRFVYPITDFLRQRREFAAWESLNAVDENITFMLERSSRDKISMDYSGFDASLSLDLIDRVMYAIGRAFTNTGGMELLTESLRETGIVTPRGVFRSRTSGLLSGTVFTSVIGTLVNYGVSMSVAYRTNTRLVSAQFLGDDSVLDYSPSIPDDEFGSAIEGFGLKTNPDKRYRSPEAVHYLQNVYSKEYQIDGFSRGMRPVSRMLNGALSYERQRREWSRWLAASRTVMQLFNCRWHPKYDELVEFVKTGDEALAENSAQEIFSKAGGREEVERVLGLDAFSSTTQGLEEAEW